MECWRRKIRILNHVNIKTMSTSKFTESELSPSLEDVCNASKKTGYIDAILDLQRILKDDFEMDSNLRHAISKAMIAKKDAYLLPTNENAYDKL